MSQQFGADAEDVNPSIDGRGPRPLGVDGHFASPRLCVIDHVVVQQGAGVEHLANYRNLFL